MFCTRSMLTAITTKCITLLFALYKRTRKLFDPLHKHISLRCYALVYLELRVQTCTVLNCLGLQRSNFPLMSALQLQLLFFQGCNLSEQLGYLTPRCTFDVFLFLHHVGKRLLHLHLELFFQFKCFMLHICNILGILLLQKTNFFIQHNFDQL